MKVMKAILALEDGSVFHGEGFGARAAACGEVCFNTSMTGYQEILTDPSYKGQIVTMTYPLIGNYGVNSQDVESWQPHVSGFVVRELSPVVSNWRADQSLGEYLEKNGIPGIQGIDTRALTKKLRVRGALNGFISTEGIRRKRSGGAGERLAGTGGRGLREGSDAQEGVPVGREGRAEREFQADAGPRTSASARNVRDPLPPADIPIVAFDFGMKYNILRRLRQHGFKVQVVPATTTAAEALKHKPAGIFLSNGPGDPSALGYAVQDGERSGEERRADFRHLPGAPDSGAGVWRKNVQTEIRPSRRRTSRSKTWRRARWKSPRKTTGLRWTRRRLPTEVTVDRINLNDQTVEGMRHKHKPMFCVQYHPEASPGPHDSTPLFAEFRALIKKS